MSNVRISSGGKNLVVLGVIVLELSCTQGVMTKMATKVTKVGQGH